MLIQHLKGADPGPFQAKGEVRPQARMGSARVRPCTPTLSARRFQITHTPYKQAFAATQHREAPW